MTRQLDLQRETGRPVRVTTDRGDVDGWLDAHREDLYRLLHTHGAVLVRGLPVRTTADLEPAVSVLLGEPMHPTERDAAATDRGGGIYTLSDGTPGEAACLHNLHSHTVRFPRILLFACLKAPAHGGAVTLGDSRHLLEALPAPLADRFRRTGWLLTRRYQDGLGVSWRDAFDTQDRAEVEAYCRRNAVDVSWLPDGQLRTTQRRPAFRRHPVTGEECWFNTVLYYSRWSMEPLVRQVLTDTYGDDGLPFDTAYGDGTPLDEDDAYRIDLAYHERVIRETWQDGDLLLVDNVRMAQGRDAFTGARDVVVAMGEPMEADESELAALR